MKKTLLYIIGMVFAVLFVSCEHKDLCYDHSHSISLKVNFDWQLAPEANPRSMSFHLFPKGEDEGWRYDFPGREGGIIRIPQGTYDLLCYNNDSEVTMFRNTDCWETFEISTHNASAMQFLTKASSDKKFPRAKGAENERMVYSVDSLWSNALGSFELLYTESDAQVTLLPQSAVQTYRVVIRSVENLQYASEFSAAISTMAGGVRVADGSLSDELVTVSFGMKADNIERSIEGAFTTFGHCAYADNTHLLVLYVIMQNGEKRAYTFDVTEKLHEADETNSRLIVIDNFSLPGSVGDGGFAAEADKWESVDIDITM